MLIAIGALMIAVGFLNRDGGTASAADAVEARVAAPGAGLSASATPAESRRRGESTVTVRLRHRRDSSPAARAEVGLWRRAYGDGVARRRARRITADVRAGRDGIAHFAGGPNEPLEIVARAEGGGPVVRRAIDPLEPGESRVVDLVVERLPAPLRLVVRSSEGTLLPGATISGFDEPLGVRAALPQFGEPLRRTNGEGIADLDGSVRALPFLVVHAAGHASGAWSIDEIERHARPLGEADRREELVVTLDPAATLVVHVDVEDGRAAPRVSINAEFALGGLLASASARSNRHGAARLVGLPSGVPIAITVLDRMSGARLGQGEVELGPGETREVRASLGDGEGGIGAIR